MAAQLPVRTHASPSQVSAERGRCERALRWLMGMQRNMDGADPTRRGAASVSPRSARPGPGAPTARAADRFGEDDKQSSEPPCVNPAPVRAYNKTGSNGRSSGVHAPAGVRAGSGDEPGLVTRVWIGM